MVVLFRLVKAGYGSYQQVKEMNTREVLQAICYEKYWSDYESTYMELNKK